MTWQRYWSAIFVLVYNQRDVARWLHFGFHCFPNQAGLQGICSTGYKFVDKVSHFDMTKTRNLDKCLKRAIKSSGLSYTEVCAECVAVSASFSPINFKWLLEYATYFVFSFFFKLQTRKVITGTDSYHYFLKKVENGLFFENMTSTEQIEFRPFSYQGVSILMMSQYVIYKSRGWVSLDSAWGDTGLTDIMLLGVLQSKANF